jgi:hypothetical protein
MQNDTLLCFSISQSKILAKRITEGIYCDSLVNHLEITNLYLDEVILAKDSTITLLNKKMQLSEAQNNNQQKVINHLKSNVLMNQQALNRQRTQKKVLSVALGVAIVLILIL